MYCKVYLYIYIICRDFPLQGAPGWVPSGVTKAASNREKHRSGRGPADLAASPSSKSTGWRGDTENDGNIGDSFWVAKVYMDFSTNIEI